MYAAIYNNQMAQQYRTAVDMLHVHVHGQSVDYSV